MNPINNVYGVLLTRIAVYIYCVRSRWSLPHVLLEELWRCIVWLSERIEILLGMNPSGVNGYRPEDEYVRITSGEL